MKKIIIPVLFIALILVSGCITGDSTAEPDAVKVDLNRGPAQKYNPTELLQEDGWEFITSTNRITELSQESQKELLEKNVIDIASWEFEKDNETIYAWSRVYDSKEDLESGDGQFTSMFAWHTKTFLVFGDEAYVGIYNSQNSPPPLLIYVAEEDTMLYISYYNSISEEGTKYYDEELSFEEDKRFLINLTKSIINPSETGTINITE